jgi:hypothetical protein
VVQRSRAMENATHDSLTVPPGSTRVPGQRADRQNRIPTSTRDISTNISAIEAALAAIDALELGEKINYT